MYFSPIVKHLGYSLYTCMIRALTFYIVNSQSLVKPDAAAMLINAWSPAGVANDVYVVRERL